MSQNRLFDGNGDPLAGLGATPPSTDPQQQLAYAQLADGTKVPVIPLDDLERLAVDDVKRRHDAAHHLMAQVQVDLQKVAHRIEQRLGLPASSIGRTHELNWDHHILIPKVQPQPQPQDE